MLFIANHGDARLLDLAAELGVTERTAYGVVVDLTDAGYLVKQKEGRRNHYEIQGNLPLPGGAGKVRTIGELVALLGDPEQRPRGPEHREQSRAAGR